MSEPLKLAARLDLSEAQALSQSLSERDFSASVVVDASDVTHMGAICVQTLISAAREAQSAGGSFEIVNAGERVEDQLSVMGLSVQSIMEGVQ